MPAGESSPQYPARSPIHRSRRTSSSTGNARRQHQGRSKAHFKALLDALLQVLVRLSGFALERNSVVKKHFHRCQGTVVRRGRETQSLWRQILTSNLKSPSSPSSRHGRAGHRSQPACFSSGAEQLEGAALLRRDLAGVATHFRRTEAAETIPTTIPVPHSDSKRLRPSKL